MKYKTSSEMKLDKTTQPLGLLGQVQLIRWPDGRHELIGASAAERKKARKWCERFVPEMVFKDPEMLVKFMGFQFGEHGELEWVLTFLLPRNENQNDWREIICKEIKAKTKRDRNVQLLQRQLPSQGLRVSLSD